MLAPSVALHRELPPGWVEVAAEVPRPPIGSSSTFTQWQAWRSPATNETLLVGCVATPIPGWVDDMRPTVEARTVNVMNASVERVVGAPIETRDWAGDFGLRLVGAPEGSPGIGIGRTFVGWDEHNVLTCFVSCASSKHDNRADVQRICDSNVRASRLDDGMAPPPPGVALRAVTWAVHHPATSVRWAGVVVFALGAVAVASRRKPRSRI